MKRLWRMLNGVGRALLALLIALALAGIVYLGWWIEHMIYSPGPNALFP